MQLYFVEILSCNVKQCTDVPIILFLQAKKKNQFDDYLKMV